MSQDISRRDLLKRGAVVAGAAMWAAPTVQVVNMAAAGASTGSHVGSPVGGGGKTSDRTTPEDKDSWDANQGWWR